MLTDIFGIDSIVENSTISKTQLYRLRSNNQDTTRKNVVILHKAIGCNLQWLATSEGPMIPSDAESLVNKTEFTNDEIEMIALFHKAPLMLKM